MKTLFSRWTFSSLNRLPLVLGAAFLVGFSTPAQADFRGGGILFEHDGCAAYGWADGHMIPVRVRYRATEDRPDGPSIVNIFDAWGGAQSVRVDVPLVPGRDRHRGFGTGMYAAFWGWETRPRVRISRRDLVLPRNVETIQEATAINLRLRIFNFAGLEGCSATLLSTMARQ